MAAQQTTSKSTERKAFPVLDPPPISRPPAEAIRSDFIAANPGSQALVKPSFRHWFATLIAIHQAAPPKFPSSESNSLSRKAFSGTRDSRSLTRIAFCLTRKAFSITRNSRSLASITFCLARKAFSITRNFRSLASITFCVARKAFSITRKARSLASIAFCVARKAPSITRNPRSLASIDFCVAFNRERPSSPTHHLKRDILTGDRGGFRASP